MKKIEFKKLNKKIRCKVVKHLDDYGYSSMGKPEIVEMTPDEFLKIVPLVGHCYYRKTIDKIKQEGYKEGRFLQDMPWIDKSEIEDHREGYMPSHEGRNRAQALKEMGIKKMRVVLFDGHKKWATRSEWQRDFGLSEKEITRILKKCKY